MARPSGYTEEIADTICERLADGASLRSICADDGMPTTQTVRNWLLKNEAFFAQYTRARDAQADALFDDCLALADNKHPDALSEGQDRRVQIDTRKWMAGKLKGKYSEKQVHEHSGIDGSPIQFGGLELTIVDPAKA